MPTPNALGIEITVSVGYVVIDTSEESKRDILFAVSSARHGASALETAASRAVATGFTVRDAAPGVDVFCVMDGGKPLVRWSLGRWTQRLYLSPARALALAQDTRAAAAEAERMARWRELREPAALMN